MLNAINIVWFKRDMRLHDHAPLKYALEDGLPLLLIYIFEPSLQATPDWSWRHWQFQYQTLLDMNQNLQKHDIKVHIFHAEVKQVFEYLLKNFTLVKVFSHQETGTRITYKRDLEMAKLFQKQNIVWKEYQNNGVLRGKEHRDFWAERWEMYMESPQETPDFERLQRIDFEPDVRFWFTYPVQKNIQAYANSFQKAGEEMAWKYLKSFVQKRSADYLKHISQPEASRSSCSRLSPYLAFGSLSVRQVYQYYLTQVDKSKFGKQLRAFRARLQWRCYFIQKFEIDGRYEFQYYNRGYKTLPQPINEAYQKAWQEGKTGFPIIDAAMRCVQETGYLNFRMRATVVSFLTHAMWQPWQSGVFFLAKQFLDYEPGIHFPQFQMQAGVLGTNIVRIYNPTKQSIEQDEKGVFIKKWLPELSQLPTALLHEPTKMTVMEQQMYHCELGVHYPKPILDLKPSLKYATETLWKWRKLPMVLQENKRILERNTIGKITIEGA